MLHQDLATDTGTGGATSEALVAGSGSVTTLELVLWPLWVAHWLQLAIGHYHTLSLVSQLYTVSIQLTPVTHVTNKHEMSSYWLESDWAYKQIMETKWFSDSANKETEEY